MDVALDSNDLDAQHAALSMHAEHHVRHFWGLLCHTGTPRRKLIICPGSHCVALHRTLCAFRTLRATTCTASPTQHISAVSEHTRSLPHGLCTEQKYALVTVPTRCNQPCHHHRCAQASHPNSSWGVANNHARHNTPCQAGPAGRLGTIPGCQVVHTRLAAQGVGKSASSCATSGASLIKTARSQWVHRS